MPSFVESHFRLNREKKESVKKIKSIDFGCDFLLSLGLTHPFTLSHLITKKIITLFAKRRHGIGSPSAIQILLSRSCFHFKTALKLDGAVTSNTRNAPTASL